MAIGMLKSFRNKGKDLHRLLLKRSELFGNVHILDIASKSKCKLFIASEEVQTLLNRLWYYGYNPYSIFQYKLKSETFGRFFLVKIVQYNYIFFKCKKCHLWL